MTTTQKTNMYERITKHGEQLKVVFNLDQNTDPIKLCKSLKRLETKAHHGTTCLCNTNTLHLLELNKYTGYDVNQTSEADQDAFFNGILLKVDKLLKNRVCDRGAGVIPTFINYDPRGYALKIKDEYIRDHHIKLYNDWGGYGIIAPDLTEA